MASMRTLNAVPVVDAPELTMMYAPLSLMRSLIFARNISLGFISPGIFDFDMSGFLTWNPVTLLGTKLV